MIRKLSEYVWEWLGFTFVELHAVLIGLGDSLSWHKTDWSKIAEYCPNDEGMNGEYHYYQMGVFVPRIIIAGIILGIIGRCVGC